MRIISTKMHGVLDYIYGILILASPWIFDFARGGAETTVPIVIGVLVLGMSVMTDYELGVIKKIPMNVHLTMDIIAGSFLALSPWLFGFSNYVYVPHLVFGLFAVMAGLMTEKSVSRRTARKAA